MSIFAPTWQTGAEPPGNVHRLLCSLQRVQRKIYLTLGSEVVEADPDLAALEDAIQALVACDLEQQRVRHKQRLRSARPGTVASSTDAERKRGFGVSLIMNPWLKHRGLSLNPKVGDDRRHDRATRQQRGIDAGKRSKVLLPYVD